MRAAAGALLLVVLSACAPKAPTLPAGTGVPFPEFASAYGAATSDCHHLRSLTAVISMSGRAGTQKLRGRIDAGLAEPDRIVLEGVAPWGKPFFVLAADGGNATLVLPRDNRYLTGSPPAAIVEALTGVNIGSRELMTALAGCAGYVGSVSGGSSFGKDWASIEAGAGTVWLRMVDGKWREAAAVKDALTVFYDDFSSGRAARVRLMAKTGDRDTADIILRVSQLELNAPLDPAVFKLEVPAGAQPLTIDELRRAGPMGERAQ
jgi:outer membrane lipoprotein-sorting protein